MRFPGCGVFEPEQSWLLRDKRDGSLAGIILCSRIAHDVAHITQICVAKAYRGQGLGRALMQHCMAQLRRCGLLGGYADCDGVERAGREALRGAWDFLSGTGSMPWFTTALSSNVDLLDVVVRCFAGDDDVVNVAFAEAGVGDADEARVGLELGDRTAAQVAHA